MTQDQQSFVVPIAKACLDWESSTGLPFKREISIITIAQAALETGWGVSSLCKPPINNYGGIKWHIPGTPKYVAGTREVISGVDVNIKDAFQAYPTIADYISDHAGTLWQWECVREALVLGLPKLCEVLGPWTDEDRKLANPMHANYSTDSNYSSTILQIIEMLGMTQLNSVTRLAMAG